MVNLFNQFHCVIISILTQAKHYRVLLYEKLKTHQHESVYKEWEQVNEAPKVIINVSLLSYHIVLTGVSWNKVSLWQSKSKSHHQEIAESSALLHYRPTCSQQVHWDSLIDHFDLRHMHHSHEKPIQKFASEKSEHRNYLHQ